MFGALSVTRAVLPVMRTQGSGLVVTISSTAGLIGQEFCTAYAASKFALEGFMESLAPEVAPYGVRTMVVEPGFFRTDLLTPESTSYAESSITDYAERTEQTVTAWNGMNGQQGGDPAKLARALVGLATSDQPPVRWVAGADAVAGVEQKARDLLAQVDAHRALSSGSGARRRLRGARRRRAAAQPPVRRRGRWAGAPSSSAWLLIGAVATEVAGTLALRVSDGFTRWLPTTLTLVGYGVSLWLFSLRLGSPVAGSSAAAAARYATLTGSVSPPPPSPASAVRGGP